MTGDSSCDTSIPRDKTTSQYPAETFESTTKAQWKCENANYTNKKRDLFYTLETLFKIHYLHIAILLSRKVHSRGSIMADSAFTELKVNENKNSKPTS